MSSNTSTNNNNTNEFFEFSSSDNDDDNATTTTTTFNNNNNKSSNITNDNEWLTKRRAQVAKASRKVRQKKKEELQTLREENESLRKERTELLSSIEELSKTLNKDPIEEVENRLLKSQLRQHALFLRSIMESMEKSPSNETLNREIVSQTCDVADTEALRLLQRSLDGQGWSPGLRLGAPVLPCEFVVVVRHELKSDGCRNVRIDVLLLDPNERDQAWGPSMNLHDARDLYTHLWSDAETFQAVFRPPAVAAVAASSSNSNNHNHNSKSKSSSSSSSSIPIVTSTTSSSSSSSYNNNNNTITDPNTSFHVSPLPEFCFENIDDPDEFKCEAQHIRESLSDGTIYDWVFLNQTKDVTMTRSSLWSGSRVDEMLYPNPPTNPNFPERKKYKRDVPVGVVKVARATRTVTVHSLVAPVETQGVRIQNQFLESIFLWEDTYGAEDTPCGRVIVLLSFPEGFRVGNIGSSLNLIDETGNVTQQFIDIIVSYVTFSLAARNARVAEAEQHVLRKKSS
jgi:hypothetical protein